MAYGADVDRELFSTRLVKVGAFRCPADHPEFPGDRPSSDYCFVFPRSVVWILHHGSQAFVADPNVVTVYNPTRPYRRTAIDGQPDRCDWFSVSPHLLEELVTAFDQRVSGPDLFQFAAAPASTGLYMRQRAVFNRVVDGPCDALFVEESTLELLVSVLAAGYGRSPGTTTLTTSSLRVVEATRSMMGADGDPSPALTDLARRSGTSPFHLCRVFRQATGLTIRGYRTLLRLRRSLEWLVETDDDLLSIALRVGFGSHSHFCRAFRAAFGITPSAYRLDGRRSSRRCLVAARLRVLALPDAGR